MEPSQRQLLDGLEKAGYSNMRVFEIGCGVGHFHQAMLERGAASATGIDLSPRMIEEAKRWARERGLDQRTRYLDGDFVERFDELEPDLAADVTVLDKVICCYPFAEAMVSKSASVTSSIYAFTLPRRRWFVRLSAALGAAVLKMTGSSFRPYVHDPARIDQLLERAGFSRCFEATTLIWLTRVYRRQTI